MTVTKDPTERLAALFDPGTAECITPPDDSGFLAGTGQIGDVKVVAFAADPRVQGGAMGERGCQAILTAYEKALAEGAPIIGVWHSGGARLGEGVRSLHGVGQVFADMTRASGLIPQISVVLGPAAGGAAYGPALTDVVIMTEDARIFVTGPDVVRSATGEVIDAEALGGPSAHAKQSGVAHLVAPDAAAAFAQARRLVTLFANADAVGDPEPEPRDLAALLPDAPNRAYDVRPLVTALLDEPGIELQARWSPNLVTTLGSLGGRTVGVIANNPLRLGGCLNAVATEKAARFVRMCDAFGVPLVVLVDVPGYLPGSGQEWAGVVRRGAKLLHAFAEAVVPRVTLVTRKAYGGAYIAMNSRSLGATAVFAWPGAEVAVMAAGSAVDILHRRPLAAAAGPDERDALHRRLVDEHERSVGGLAVAVDAGVVDAVIAPADTRRRIATAIHDAGHARGQHANIPL